MLLIHTHAQRDLRLSGLLFQIFHHHRRDQVGSRCTWRSSLGNLNQFHRHFQSVRVSFKIGGSLLGDHMHYRLWFRYDSRDF